LRKAETLFSLIMKKTRLVHCKQNSTNLHVKSKFWCRFFDFKVALKLILKIVVTSERFFL
jgi:hypothetical protein